MKCHQQSFPSASFQVQRERSGASWSAKAKGEDKATFRQERSSWSPTGSLLPYCWDAHGEPCSRCAGAGGPPACMTQESNPSSPAVMGHRPPSCLQLWGQETSRHPSLHWWRTAKDTAWGKALLHSTTKTSTSMNPKSHVALTDLSLRVCPLRDSPQIQRQSALPGEDNTHSPGSTT